MTLVTTVLSMMVGAYIFGRFISLDQFLPSVQAIVTVLSIMMAAVFVRLNRGMPTLDWKSVDLDQRVALTGKISEVTLEYVVICGCLAITLVGFLGLQIVGAPALKCLQSQTLIGIIGACGGLLGLCGARMTYVVWRDYDIVRLQKRIIDDAGHTEQKLKEQTIAEERISVIKSSGIRPG